jgi:aspartyl-tRNA(Asn)/glutamyl-tRNA(Gln) amidotransferase subunit C
MDPSGGYPAGEMPSDHDPAQLVATLADLARLELSAEEAAEFGVQLQTILGYIRSLQAVDVEGVPEYLSAEQPGSGLREDQPRPDPDELEADRALASVPVLRGRLVAVPKFKD